MKKVLSLVLVLAMVLGSFSFVSAASYTDVTGTTYASAVERLSTLGILNGYPDGTFKPAGSITRAEFAAVAVRAKGLEAVAVAAKGLPTGFTDVLGTHWASGYVGTAARLGIVNGIGFGMFAPEAPVKYEEAVTMMVRALGYEMAAQAKGGYPYGYLIVANEIDLLDGVKGIQGVAATRGLVAQLTDNALEIPMMIQVGFGTDTKWVVSGKENTTEVTLLDSMGFEAIEGRVTAVNTTKNTITLKGDKTNTLDVAKGFDFYAVEGVTIKAWVNDDVVVAYTVKDEVKFDAVKYDTDEKEIKLVTAGEFYEVASGYELTVNGDDKTAANFKADYAKVVLNDDDEIIWAEGYNFEGLIIVEEVEDEIVYDLNDDELDLEDFLLVKDGKTVAIEDLVKGDIVFFNETEEFAVVYNNSIEGTIERVYTTSIKIDGKIYDFANDVFYLDGKDMDEVDTTLDDNEFVAMMEEKEEVVAFKNFEGKIVLIEGTRGTVPTTTLGAILTAEAKSYTTRNKEYLPLDMINQDGKKVSFDANQDVLDDSEDFDMDDVIAVNTVIEYKVDEDGALTEIMSVLSGGVETAEVAIDARYADGYRLKDSTVVFLLDSEGDVDEVFTWANAKGYFGEMTEFEVYYSSGDAKYIVVTESDAGEYEETAGVLTRVRTISSGKFELTINIDGKAYTFDVTENYSTLKGKVVEFKVNEAMDEIEKVDGEFITPADVEDGAFTLVSSSKKSFKVDGGTELQLTSDAVVFDATVTTPKIVSFSDVKNNQIVDAYLDGESAKYVKYLVITSDVISADKVKANEVDAMIADLPLPAALTLDDKAEVTAARTAYTNLTTAQKALVTKLAVLVAAETKIAELEASDPDLVKLAAVNAANTNIKMITALEAAIDTVGNARYEDNKLAVATLMVAERPFASLAEVEAAFDIAVSLMPTAE